MKPKKIKILILEDSREDVLLIKRALQKGGLVFSSVVVENELDYIHELKVFKPHAILSDYSLPDFSGLSAMVIKEQLRPNIPFIFVTGTIGEELAAETILNGASGFILKSDLTRLAELVTSSVENVNVLQHPSETKRSGKWKQLNEINKILLKEVANYLKSVKDNSNTGQYIENIEKHIHYIKKYNNKKEEI